MASVFTDRIDSKHVTIATPGNWTQHLGAMPNGDNCFEKESQSGDDTFGIIGTDLETAQVVTTLQFWIRAHSDWNAGGNVYLIRTSKSDGSNSHISVVTNGISGSLATLNIATIRGCSLSFDLTVDQWHMITVFADTTYSGSVSSAGHLNVYKDAVHAGTNNTGTNAFRPAGAGSTHGLLLASPTTVTPCDLGKITWWTRGLTQAEMQNHYFLMMVS